MLVQEKNELTMEIEELAKSHDYERSALIPILQSIQQKHRHISEFAQQEVARVLDVHPVEVYSVISFYHFLNPERSGRNIVRLCKTIICDMAGKAEVEEAVERELGISFGETTKDGAVTLEHTNCLGMCDQGPAMMINDKVYTRLDPETACRLLSELK
jgi:NADH:ubiquinone oxidoreductase subunit E